MLVGIFLGFLGAIALFTHVHYIDGHKVVHSHPYSTNSNSPESPGHTHTSGEIQLIHHISTTPFMVGAALVLYGIFRIFTGTTLSPSSSLKDWSHLDLFYLRGPPAAII